MREGRSKHIIALFFLILHLHLSIAQFECYKAPAVPEDRRINPNKLVVAQYNCEWLFLGNSSSCPGMCSWSDGVQQNQHFENILSEIRLLDADILNLAEVENCEVLQLLAERLDSGYKAYMVKGTDTATNQNVGILTRIDPIVNLQRTEATCPYPLSGSTCGNTNKAGNKSVSKHYYTKFLINNEEVIMMGMHLLSNPNSPPNCVQREGQACVLSNYLDQILSSVADPQSSNIILIGDMNDYDAAVLDSSNNLPTSRVMNILKNGVNSVDERRGSARQFSLTNPAYFVTDVANRYTCWYDYYNNCADNEGLDRSSIDHILLSSRMMERVEKMEYSHNYPNGCDNDISDHWPVLLTLNWPLYSSDPSDPIPPPPVDYNYSMETFIQNDNYSDIYSYFSSYFTTWGSTYVRSNTVVYENTPLDIELLGVGIAVGVAITLLFFCGLALCFALAIAIYVFLKKRNLIGAPPPVISDEPTFEDIFPDID